MRGGFAVNADPGSALPVVVVEAGRATWSTLADFSVRRSSAAVMLSEADATDLAEEADLPHSEAARIIRALIRKAS